MRLIPRLLRRVWCTHEWELMGTSWDIEISQCTKCGRVRWEEDDEQDLLGASVETPTRTDRAS